MGAAAAAATTAATATAATAGNRRRARLPVRVLFVFGVLLVAVGAAGAGASESERPGPVYFVDISGTIDLGLAPYLERVLGDAEQAGASAVVVEIDTPGGRLDAVLQMRDSLLGSPLRTVALVESTAFSAGALVAIACREIAMRPGSVMGAATPVVGSGEVADAKTISAVRSTFEATAEERGRDPEIAAAMVDPEVAVEGLVEQGQLLALTVSTATQVGYADAVVADRGALLAHLGLGDRRLVGTTPGLAERLVRLITNPVVSSLLLTMGMLAIVADLASGGIGAGVAVGLGLQALFFWGHMLAGLAGWEDLALVSLGLVLIAVEVLVVPGLGVPGILGLVALLGGAFLAMINRDLDFVTNDELIRAALTVGTTLIATVVGLVVILALLGRRGPPRGLILETRLGVGAPVGERPPRGWLRWFGGTDRLPSDRSPDRHAHPGAGEKDTAPVAPPPPDDAGRSLLGATGTALTDLRPSGIADIDGERVDVVTTGEYLHQGDPVQVIRDERYRRVVRRREP